MEYADLGRQEIIKAFAEGFPAYKNSIHISESPLLPRIERQAFRAVWLDAARTDLPDLIVTAEADFRDALAYLTTYGPLSPLTSEISIIPEPDLLTVVGANYASVPAGALDAFAGLVLSEMIIAEESTDPEDVRMSAAQATYSWAVACAVLNGSRYSFGDIGERWVTANQRVRSAREADIAALAFQAETLRDYLYKSPPTLFPDADRYHALLALAQRSANERELWNGLLDAEKSLRLDPEYAGLPREQRVSALSDIVVRINQTTSPRPLVDLICAIAVTVCFGGSPFGYWATRTVRSVGFEGVSGWFGIVLGLMGRRGSLYDAQGIVFRASRQLAARTQRSYGVGAIQYEELAAFDRRALERVIGDTMLLQVVPGVVSSFQRTTKPARRKAKSIPVQTMRRLQSLVRELDVELSELAAQ